VAIEVEEAGGQPTEPAVAKAGIGFFLEDFQPVDALLPRQFSGNGLDEKVGDVVCQGSPDQELH
jgi:hypothetical protein